MGGIGSAGRQAWSGHCVTLAGLRCSVRRHAPKQNAHLKWAFWAQLALPGKWLREKDLNLYDLWVMSPTSYQTAPSRGKGSSVTYSALLGSETADNRDWAIDELNQGHGRVIANPKAHFQDTGVASGTRLEAGAELVE